MLRFVHTDLFNSSAQTLVNTVNTVGVMGKGIAKQFRDRYPPMFREYKAYCDSAELTVGALHVWRGPDKWVLNFPTKTTWRLPSKIDYIEAGLDTFCNNYWRLGIRSVAFPPLGCGNGELDWAEVKPLMIRYLHRLDIPVWIHEVFYKKGFKPEQTETRAKLPPETFSDFARDVRSVIVESRGRFRHWISDQPFIAETSDGGALVVYVDKKVVVDEDFLAMAWVGLRLGVLTTEYFGSREDSPGAYILPIAARLPYVQTIRFEAADRGKATTAGLVFNQNVDTFARKALEV
jgi:O-acetyl-ADP-ribose deacetylase (regulator of RNase III)